MCFLAVICILMESHPKHPEDLSWQCQISYGNRKEPYLKSSSLEIESQERGPITISQKLQKDTVEVSRAAEVQEISDLDYQLGILSLYVQKLHFCPSDYNLQQFRHCCNESFLLVCFLKSSLESSFTFPAPPVICCRCWNFSASTEFHCPHGPSSISMTTKGHEVHLIQCTIVAERLSYKSESPVILSSVLTNVKDLNQATISYSLQYFNMKIITLTYLIRLL